MSGDDALILQTSDLTKSFKGFTSVSDAIAAATFLLIGRIVPSPFGAILAAIKENEARTVSLDYDADCFKLITFTLSAALSELAGALKVLVLGFETLTDVHWSMSGTVILMTLVGGLGTRWGPVLGAVVIVALQNKLGEIGAALPALTDVDWFLTLGDSVTVVTAALFLLTVLFLRHGLAGALASRELRLPGLTRIPSPSRREGMA